MAQPSVNILIPCYNSEMYIKECLESVLAQTWPSLEIIAFDDASTDNTWGILQTYSSRVRSFRSSVNIGVSRARNFLLQRSGGEYIHFQDADDLMHPCFIELMLPWLLTGDYEVVLCNVGYFFGNNPKNLKGGWFLRPKFTDEDWLTYVIESAGSSINSIYKREAILRIGGFREDIECAEDYDLHLRLAEAGIRFAVVEQTLALARQKDKHFYRRNDLLVAAHEVLVDFYNRLNSSGRILSDRLRAKLAGDFWLKGRKLTEIGKHNIANEAFRYSQKICRDYKFPGSLIYRILLKILGVTITERVRYLFHRLKIYLHVFCVKWGSIFSGWCGRF